MPADMSQVTRAYLNIREARSKLRKEYEAEDNELKASQAKLEAVMLDNLNKSGVESARTEHGTFYRQKNMIPTASDWDAFYKWVREEDAFDALERRIKRTFIAEYMDEHEGALPPGVSTHTEFVVRVRKAN